MATCPAGHDSAADDYCDVCGLPIGEQPAPSAGEEAAPPVAEGSAQQPAGDAAPATSACPNCQADNPPNALFCEACGYDYTTGSMPRPVSAPSLESMLNLPERTAESAKSSPAGATDKPMESIAPPLADAWVAEVWIDPDWYAAQESDDPLPSAGVPVVVHLKTTSVLVGRRSQSRSINPDIDLSTDTGISRRHCQFTTDGTRWWVEDLGSSNGTYLGSVTGALPDDPIPAGEKREIGVDDRVYLGAWTRIVIRKAEPGEVA